MAETRAEDMGAETAQDAPRPENSRDAFFVGYLPMPAALVTFLLCIVAALIAGVAGFALAFATAQQDPGDGTFRFDLGYQTISGVLTLDPYPVLHVQPSAEHPNGRQIILVGQGKRGVQAQARPLAGKLVEVGGIFLMRGDTTMLQVGGRVGIRLAQAGAQTGPGLGAGGGMPAVIPAAEPLGRHRLAGEIVDGKCCLGAMRPGVGKMHMACANLCLVGGIPPLFVTRDAAGAIVNIFLMADPEGRAVTDALYDYVSLAVSVEGAVERRGGLLVFKIDPTTLTVL